MRPFLTRVITSIVFAAGLIACDSGSTTGPTAGTFATSPSSAELVVSDITNFWTAYDEFQRTTQASAFQSRYLDHASPGLADFIVARQLTAASLAAMVRAYPRYFAAIRPVMASLANGAVSAQVRAHYATLQSLYPSAVFPTVTFLIGRFSTGGTTRNNRILIGSEFYVADSLVPRDELAAFPAANVKPLLWLPVIVAHEHTHILQQRAGGIFGHPTLLEQALTEGAADFVSELVSGRNINGWLAAFGLANEHQLWLDFQAQRNGTDISQWLYNQGNPPPGRPGDLGYFIGYRIAQAYYARTTAKTQALRDIIEVRDAPAFLAASGYNP